MSPYFFCWGVFTIYIKHVIIHNNGDILWKIN